jgi:PAS domain S-box-containing protein
MVTILVGVAYILLLLTVWTSTYEAWRRRETRRLDILFVVGSLVLVNLLRHGPSGSVRGNLWVAGSLLLATQPFLLLRLVRHFRDVPVWLHSATVAAIGIGAIGLFTPERSRVGLFIAGYAAVLSAYVAIAFGREVRVTSGVTAIRLACAGAPTVMLATAFLLAGTTDLFQFLGVVRSGSLEEALGQPLEVLTAGIFICYFFAFAPPRRLAARWQRTEQARFLSDTSIRDPEDRGKRAAKDLDQAVRRSMSNACVMVALRPDPSADDLVVRATSDTALTGLRIVPAAPGLAARAVETGAGVFGTPDQCEPVLASPFRALGAHVLVAPIRTATQTWGLVAVVQRRGSLFPEDDLRLLAQLGRYTGTALDHAHLVIEARERERKLADRRVHAVESQMSLMLDSIKDYAMFLLDAQGRVVTWHVGAGQIFGYGAGEMTGRSAADLFTMAPAEFTEWLDQASRAGHDRREGPCRRKNGARFIGVTTLRPLEGNPGEVPGFVAVTRDVTEQREFESRLRQSQKMEAIGQLAGGIAHDFNNLIITIQGRADILANELRDDEARLQEVGEIQKEAQRAAALTGQLLAFTRRRMVEPRAIDLSRLVADLLPMLRRMIGEHVEIVQETAAEGATVIGDRSQVEQIILNLAVNARDAMPTGGRLTIRTSALWLDAATAAGEVPPGPYVLLEVIDTGVGMDAATQSRIFEPFFTTKELRGGTGLGLANVYGIARQMGGAVRVESELDRGTRFRLYFPETRDREVAVRPPARADAPRGTETVLLVEDDDGVSRFLAGTLRRSGYQVLVASHPAAALALVETYADPIHLVITDVVLPGGTGLELVLDLAELRPGLPALYISGYADGVLADQGTVPKASHFLQKPFSAADLLTRIRQILSVP